MSIDRKTLDRQYRAFGDSVFNLDAEEERILRVGFGEKIEDLIRKFPNDPDLYHKYGLCFYEIPRWTDGDKTKIEIAFNRAIILDGNSAFSRIFLTHFYYDIREYSLALKTNCLSANLNLASIPSWRLVKMEELNLCCRLHLNQLATNGVAVALSHFQESLSNLDTDVRDAACPFQLVEAIKNIDNTSDELLVELIEWVIRETS